MTHKGVYERGKLLLMGSWFHPFSVSLFTYQVNLRDKMANSTTHTQHMKTITGGSFHTEKSSTDFIFVIIFSSFLSSLESLFIRLPLTSSVSTLGSKVTESEHVKRATPAIMRQVACQPVTVLRASSVGPKMSTPPPCPEVSTPAAKDCRFLKYWLNTTSPTENVQLQPTANRKL